MESFFNENLVLLFFFSVIAIYNYSDLKEYQKICIIYIAVYSMVVLNKIDFFTSLLFLFISLFCFFEIFSKDSQKYKILLNPIYKIIDCLYLSFAQYAFLFIVISLVLFELSNIVYIFKFISILIFIWGVTVTLQQKFVINSFTDMYRIFSEYPINRVKFNKKLDAACQILISVEDRKYFERKGYTFLSYDYISNVLKERILSTDGGKIHIIFESGRNFFKNAIDEKRGYSTIPMQLMRSIVIKRGYNCKIRRKLFELIYCKIFFNGIEKMFKEDKVARRDKVKEYYLYIYFHKVNTFLGNASFSKFLNAFDMQYNEKNKKDIYDCSNEGIFIACMGLSKRAKKINGNNIDVYLSSIDRNVDINRNEVLKMVSEMMSKPYKGNYLK